MFVPNEPIVKHEPFTTEPLTVEPKVEPKPAPPTASVFLFDPDNLPYLERRTSKARLHPFNFSPTTILIFGAATLMMAYFSLHGLVTLLHWGLTTYTGETTYALVSDSRVESTRNQRSSAYYIEYTYSVNGQSYVDAQYVSFSIYRMATQAKEVTIRYWPLIPSIVRLSGDFEDASAIPINLVLFILFGFVSAVLGVILYWLSKGWWTLREHNRRLQRDGRLIYGEVISSKGEVKPKIGFSVTISYGVHSPESRWLVREQTRTLNWMQDKPLPTKGTPLAIYYATDNIMEVL